MDKQAIENERQRIIGQIMKYVPLIRPFFELDMTLGEYSKKLYDFKVNPIHAERQTLIKNVIKTKLKKIFGNGFEEKLNLSFDPKLAFNIADHHMVLSHPFLFSANIVSSVEKLSAHKKQPPIIVISSGDVPPNNFFSKNGFTFHKIRVPLFSTSEREYCTYYIPERELNFVDRLKQINRWAEFNAEDQKFLINEQKRIDGLDYSRCRNYADQLTITVKESWPLLFEPKMRATLPELIYITQEEVVTECLIELLKGDNIISRALFDPKFRSLILDNFRGIVTTWRETEQKGTHFFWHKYPGEPRSIRMYLEGEFLVPADSRFKDIKIHMDKDTIINLLQKREIYPGLFLIFSVLNFYLGVKPLTGYGSVVYMAFIKDAWIKTLGEAGLDDEAELVKGVDTNGFIAGLVLIFKRYQDKIQTLYAHDIMFEHGITEDYLQTIFNMKFKDVISVAVADMYDYYASKYVPPAEQIKQTINFDDLANITFDWIK